MPLGVFAGGLTLEAAGAVSPAMTSKWQTCTICSPHSSTNHW
jgi:hypothetical protein